VAFLFRSVKFLYSFSFFYLLIGDQFLSKKNTP
jgi:hypothetical protein